MNNWSNIFPFFALLCTKKTFLYVQPPLPPPDTRPEAQYEKVFLSVETFWLCALLPLSCLQEGETVHEGWFPGGLVIHSKITDSKERCARHIALIANCNHKKIWFCFVSFCFVLGRNFSFLKKFLLLSFLRLNFFSLFFFISLFHNKFFAFL